MTPLKREHAFFQVKSVELGGRQKVANCRQALCVKIATFWLSWAPPRAIHTQIATFLVSALKTGARRHTHAHGLQRFSFRPLKHVRDDTHTHTHNSPVAINTKFDRFAI